MGVWLARAVREDVDRPLMFDRHGSDWSAADGVKEVRERSPEFGTQFQWLVSARDLGGGNRLVQRPQCGGTEAAVADGPREEKPATKAPRNDQM